MNNQEDVIDYIVTRVSERLATRLLGSSPPPVLKPSEYELVLDLGHGLSNQEIAHRTGVHSGVIANKLCKLIRRTGTTRPRLALWGQILGLALAESPIRMPKVALQADPPELPEEMWASNEN